MQKFLVNVFTKERKANEQITLPISYKQELILFSCWNHPNLNPLQELYIFVSFPVSKGHNKLHFHFSATYWLIMDFSVSRCWYSAGDWYMFFIKESFRTSSFFHFRDWSEYKHGGAVLLPNLIAFLHTFRISFLKTFFFPFWDVSPEYCICYRSRF